MNSDSHIPECIICGGAFALNRWALGYKTCLPCGEKASKQVVRCIAPLNKSNYMLITDLADLKGLNPKRTT